MLDKLKDVIGFILSGIEWLVNSSHGLELLGSLVTICSTGVALFLGIHQKKPNFSCTVSRLNVKESSTNLEITIRNMSQYEIVMVRIRQHLCGKKCKGLIE